MLGDEQELGNHTMKAEEYIYFGVIEGYPPAI